ncbi:MAG: hypothetical protein PUB87_06795 [Eubacteriaceae bacterium]|nr:hypothetical protein [Eubacteriaceae bacterium]
MPPQFAGPIKVLAVFEKGNPPVPCKYKVVDNRGEVETIAINKITWIDRRAIPFVDYHCETYYENYVQRYQLRYWKDSFRWELETERRKK